MKIIVGGNKYKTYEEAKKALGGDISNIPENLPMQTIGTWELFRDGDGNAVLIVYSDSGVVLNYFHAYYDEVQKMWRWQV